MSCHTSCSPFHSTVSNILYLRLMSKCESNEKKKTVNTIKLIVKFNREYGSAIIN